MENIKQFEKIIIFSIGFFYVCSAFSETTVTAFVFKKRHVNFFIQADGSYSQTIEIESQILNSKAVEDIKSMRFAFFEKDQSVNLISAEIIKPNQKKITVSDVIIVPALKITPKGPIFPDRKTMSIVFQGLEIFDTVHYKIRLKQKMPKFPNYFSSVQVFSADILWEDVEVNIDVPRNYPLKIYTAGMKGKNAKLNYYDKTWSWVLDGKKLSNNSTEKLKNSFIQISSFSKYSELTEVYSKIFDKNRKYRPLYNCWQMILPKAILIELVK